MLERTARGKGRAANVRSQRMRVSGGRTGGEEDMREGRGGDKDREPRVDLIRRVDAGALLEQQADDLEVAVLRCKDEGRPPVLRAPAGVRGRRAQQRNG